MQTQLEPKLEKPGAGLPWPRNWIARFLVPRMARKAVWTKSEKHFAMQAGMIQDLIKNLPANTMQTQVLVPRLLGIEDSSRFWSIAMTLEHLIIVSDAMTDIVIQLSQEKTPPFAVDTAQVKPKKAFDADVSKKQFDEMLVRVNTRLRQDVKDKNAALTHVHPWFGPFTAQQWHWLLGTHMAIHHNQIKEIFKRLPA